MRRRLIPILILSLLAGAPLAAQAQTATAPQAMAYGHDPLQAIDFWPGKGTKAPLVIFVHGGGWKRGSKDNASGNYKAPHYSQTYAYASINYRLVPDATEHLEIIDALESGDGKLARQKAQGHLRSLYKASI